MKYYYKIVHSSSVNALVSANGNRNTVICDEIKLIEKVMYE